MKNKFLLIWIILFFISSLFSIKLNKVDLTKLETAINQKIPNNSLIFLDSKIDEINAELIPYLISKKYKVLAKPIPNNYLIEINVSHENVDDYKRIIFFKAKIIKDRVNVLCKITEPKNSQLVYYKNFQYTKKISNNATNWYEPALITTIIGGLAYLFYFGTN